MEAWAGGEEDGQKEGKAEQCVVHSEAKSLSHSALSTGTPYIGHSLSVSHLVLLELSEKHIGRSQYSAT